MIQPVPSSAAPSASGFPSRHDRALHGHGATDRRWAWRRSGAPEPVPDALATGLTALGWLEAALGGADALGEGAPPCRAHPPSGESETSARTAATLTTGAAS